MKKNNPFQDLKKRFSVTELKRHELQNISSAAQRQAKQAIFSVHRDELDKAETLLKNSSDGLAKGRSILKDHPMLDSEGIWRSALEEFYEAKFFINTASNHSPFESADFLEEPSILIGALSDLTGEMARLAVRKATLGDKATVERLFKSAENMVAFLMSLDSTGYLRTKTDQAKQHLRRLEELRYDISKNK